MPEPALQTLGLRKAYGPHVVLDDVTLSIDPGTLAVVSGANGTGKSTLLRCVAGLLPFEGSAGTPRSRAKKATTSPTVTFSGSWTLCGM